MKIHKYDFVPGAYSVLIFTAALIPVGNVGGGIPHADKFLHGIAFAVLGLLLGLSGRKHKLWLGLSWLAACAVFSELVQGLVPHREFNWMDMAADIIGGLPVFLLTVWLKGRPRKKTSVGETDNDVKPGPPSV
jgi:hypothetical protein